MNKKDRFKEKKNGIQFRVDNAIHMIPSRDFPLSTKRKSEMELFVHSNTTAVVNKKVIEIFNSFNYKIGRCFENALALKEMLEKEGEKDWEYYSGWLFPIAGYPVFHALLSKDRAVLDYTNAIIDEKMIEKIKGISDKKKIREIFLEQQILMNSLPNSKTKICGRVHEEFTFIGCRDVFENSIKIFKSIDEGHISYRGKGMNLRGLSSMQESIKKKQENI